MDVQPSSVGWQVRIRITSSPVRSSVTGQRPRACTLSRERLRSDPTSVLTDRSGGVFTNHILPTPPFAFRGLRTADIRTTLCAARASTQNEPHPRPQSPPSVIAEHVRPTTPLLWSPPHPTPRMCLLARLRPASSPLRPVYASAVPPTRSHFLTQSTHVADQQQTESLLTDSRHVT